MKNAKRKQTSDVNSASSENSENIATLTTKTKYFTTVMVRTRETFDHAQNIQDFWTAFPDSVPFMGVLIDNNQVFICGYIYGNKTYGSVTFFSYNSTTGSGIVRCSNGVFSTKYLT